MTLTFGAYHRVSEFQYLVRPNLGVSSLWEILVMSDDESKAKQTALGQLAGSLEHIVKIGGALVALSYVFGLVVLNVHLGRYGYFTLGLLQLDYIAAGLWALSPVALIYFLIFAVVFTVTQDFLFQDKDQPQPNSVLNKITLWVSGLFIGIVLIIIFFYYMDISFRKLWLLAMGFGFFVGAGLGLTPILIATTKESRERILAGAMLIWMLVLVPFYLLFFGRYIYETIPSKWGGGQMAEVILVAKDDNARTLMESGGVQFTDARKSVPVKLILATEKELLITSSQQSRGLKLNHELVVAIIFNQ